VPARERSLTTIIGLILRPIASAPPERSLDGEGRPHFPRDAEVSPDGFRRPPGGADPDVRAHRTGNLSRQAKPDYVFSSRSRPKTKKRRSRTESGTPSHDCPT